MVPKNTPDPPQIVLHVECVDALLGPPTPHPLRQLAVDRHAEERLVNQLRKLPLDGRIRLSINLPRSEIARARDMTARIRRHFSRRREETEIQLAETLHDGRKSLLVGFIVLSTALACVEAVNRLVPLGPLSRSLQEGLTILGWVALWRPAELLVHEWRPLRRHAAIFRGLEQAEIEVAERHRHSRRHDKPRYNAEIHLDASIDTP